MRVTSALFLDFDNIFGGLSSLDPSAARSVAQNPDTWMATLALRHILDGERTWLVRRCYMNPSGSIHDPVRNERVYFSQFRPFFTGAGFEVVDCPPLTQGAKNAADIRIVIDVLDALSSGTRFDEFVIASSDADFTPLLHRIRAADRRITVLSSSNTAAAYRALTDQTLDAQALIELLTEESNDTVDELLTIALKGPPDESATEELRAQFERLVRERYEAADGPINLARESTWLRDTLGNVVVTSNWFGAGGFIKAMAALDLPGLTFSQHFMWDSTRISPPEAGRTSSNLPEVVAQVTSVTDMPPLDALVWPEVFETLAFCARTHEFNLSEATKWARDHLVELGHNVGRAAVTFCRPGGGIRRRSVAQEADANI